MMRSEFLGGLTKYEFAAIWPHDYLKSQAGPRVQGSHAAGALRLRAASLFTQRRGQSRRTMGALNHPRLTLHQVAGPGVLYACYVGYLERRPPVSPGRRRFSAGWRQRPAAVTCNSSTAAIAVAMSRPTRMIAPRATACAIRVTCDRSRKRRSGRQSEL
jgi:hypothetical protein